MKLRAAAVFAALLLTGNVCTAQGTFEGWYQVELIVYSRPQHNSVEVWPKDINLKYPLNWQPLYSPEASEDGPIHDQEQTPFYRLAKDARKLNAVKDRLNAQPGFKVLFHEAWRQIIVDESDSPAILVFGGKEFDAHNELEGSVTIHVSRYLHINTNLWLTQFQANTGHNRNQWPSLPQQPQKRLAQQPDSAPAQAIFTGGNMATAKSEFLSFNDSEADRALTDFLAAPFVPGEIITMQQSRKMRSDELHYLDHPRLGVLVKILPYTAAKTTGSTAPGKKEPIEAGGAG